MSGNDVRAVKTMKRDLGELIDGIWGLERVEATSDGAVIIGTGPDARPISKAVGMPMAPGDQVVVLRKGHAEVAICAVTTLGTPE